MKKQLLLLALAPLSVSLSIAPVGAQNETPVKLDSSEAAALALMDKAAAAYAALDGLSMKFSSFYSEGGKNTRSTSALAFEKAGRARISSTLLRAPIVVDTTVEGVEASVAQVMQQIPNGASVPLASLLQGKNPLREETLFGLKVKWKGIRLLPDNGVAAIATNPAVPSQNPSIFSFYFDPTDNLLRRVEVKEQIKGKFFLDLTTLSDIQINPQFAADMFLGPPAPARKIAAPRDEDIYWDPKIKVGAMPFALTGADLGKYRGKVVLLDFWATWCGPCVREMPSVLKNYGKYHAKGFEVIGISLDESESDLTGFVKARKVPWTQVFDGKAWKGANVAKYGVRGIPFTVLVGKDGKIAAINPRGEELEPAVKAALAK